MKPVMRCRRKLRRKAGCQVIGCRVSVWSWKPPSRRQYLSRHLAPDPTYIAARCGAFRPSWRLQLSEQYLPPPPIVRFAGTHVPHTLQRTNFSCDCGLRIDEAPPAEVPDRSCCKVWINFFARRRYGSKRRIKSASRRAMMAAKIMYFNLSSPCFVVRLAYHEDKSMAGKRCDVSGRAISRCCVCSRSCKGCRSYAAAAAGQSNAAEALIGFVSGQCSPPASLSRVWLR